MDIPNLRWWGWGTLDQSYSLEGRVAFWPTLQEWLDLPDKAIAHQTPPVSIDEIALPPSRLDDPMLASLRKLLGEQAVRTGKLARVEHAYGKSYQDLIRIRSGHVPNPPDAVVYPTGQGQVVSLLEWAADRDISIVPFGGGSSVTGGVEPEPGDRRTITLDLASLDQVISIDPIARVARIQAGATGPELEKQLNAQGFTLGHFPESFEFSTLGGWISTRSAGHNSTGYGKIDGMTQAVRLITPVGICEARDTRSTAAGPSLLQAVIGSEGFYGIITEATMRIEPLPRKEDYRGLLFRSLEDGVAAARDLVHCPDVRPSLVRLSDPPGTAANAAMSHDHRGLRRLVDATVTRFLRARKYDPTQGSTLMLLGFDGDVEWTTRQWSFALQICSEHGGLSLGRSAGRSWVRDRFAQPYLRDVLLNHGLIVGTLQTATTWSNLTNLCQAIGDSTREAISTTGGGPGYVMTHIAHAYLEGASLHSTFLGQQVPDSDPFVKQAQWREIRQAAATATMLAGGTLSHNYGIGHDNTQWLEEEIGHLGVKALRALKKTFDPLGMINPGILLP